MRTLLTQITTATSGTLNLPDTKQDVVVFHDAGLTVDYAITFPPSPRDGQTVIICSSGGVTNLNISATVGIIANALGSIGGGAPASWIYSVVRNKWFKIG